MTDVAVDKDVKLKYEGVISEGKAKGRTLQLRNPSIVNVSLTIFDVKRNNYYGGAE